MLEKITEGMFAKHFLMIFFRVTYIRILLEDNVYLHNNNINMMTGCGKRF